MKSNWKLRTVSPTHVDSLSESCGISPFLAKLLLLRNYTTPEETLAFLSPEKQPIPDPFLFTEMDIAVERILQAREQEESILIYGDYDVDGITATCIMLEVLRELDLKADYYIPDRLTEGYGLDPESIRHQAHNYSLIITVDCGTTAVDAISIAQEMGVDIIVTDHHDPGHQRPPALAVINPHRQEERYPFQHLSGAGVAWKLAMALRQAARIPHDENTQLELVAMGMIADIVPLIGENRTLLARSWPRFHQHDRPGLFALMQATKVISTHVSTYELGFRITPHLNAAGRMENPDLALDLLYTQDQELAAERASHLLELNQQRKKIEKQIFDEACAMVENQNLLQRNNRVLLVVGENWHRGVLGLTANKISQRYKRPAFILSREEDLAIGSARSHDGVNLIPTLDQIRTHTLACGGHTCAAGIKLEPNKIHQFEEALYQAADQHWSEAQEPTQFIDDTLLLEQIDLDLMADIKHLEPFGEGNQEPLFHAKASLDGCNARIVGNGHLRITLNHPRGVINAIGFNQGDRLEQLNGSNIDLLFRCRLNDYRGRKSVDLHLVDFVISSNPVTIHTNTQKETPPITTKMDRQRLLHIYSILDKAKDEHKALPGNYVHLLAKAENIPLEEFRVAVRIFIELDLAAVQDDKIVLREYKQKKELSESPTYRAMNSS